MPRGAFEVFTQGSTNPWGLDFDARGQAFITNCVIPHVFHAIPGAHYQRMYGLDLDPHTYGLMESCADHLHWAGGWWKTSLGGKHGEAGGGHAHSGAMVYLGDNWPAEHRGNLFMVNIHGQRLNQDTLRRQGSGFVASHAADMAFSQDPWFRGVAVKYGPDGGVYIADWNDDGECHDYELVRRETGRIFKITYGQPKPASANMKAASDAQLVDLILGPREWHARQARLELQSRAAAGQDLAAALPALSKAIDEPGEATRRLRALWALHILGRADDALLERLLGASDEELRGWAVRLLAEDRGLTQPQTATLAKLAGSDPSLAVRREIASALQRLPADTVRPLAKVLLASSDDYADDPNLPLLVWYGVKPLATNADGGLDLLAQAKLPLHQQYLARRLTEQGPEVSDRLVAWLATANPGQQASAIRGMYEALKGRRNVPGPQRWPAVFVQLQSSLGGEDRERLLALGLLYGDPLARQLLLGTATDRTRGADVRTAALEALLDAPNPELLANLLLLLADDDLRLAAIRGLARFDDPQIAGTLLERYAELSPAEQQEALATLSTRRPFAQDLLAAIEAGRVPAKDLPAFLARQIAALDDAQLTARLTKAWGQLRPATGDKAAEIARYRAVLTSAGAVGDRAAGRAVFDRHCASCHRLFDAGQAIGPELTGSQRANLDYVLENLVDPSAIVPTQYRVTNVVTADGRLVAGMIGEENDRVLVIQTAGERVILDKQDIETRATSGVSMMPEGLPERMSAEELRDLAAYLASPQQVEAPSQ
ncbi:MAG: PVC-type heme-binding CxxCH protein [Pirellulales bacterium]